MPKYRKVIPFPVRVVPRAGFNALIYPRFADAFGDRGDVAPTIIDQAKHNLAVVNPLRNPPCH